MITTNRVYRFRTNATCLLTEVSVQIHAKSADEAANKFAMWGEGQGDGPVGTLAELVARIAAKGC